MARVIEKDCASKRVMNTQRYSTLGAMDQTFLAAWLGVFNKSRSSLRPRRLTDKKSASPVIAQTAGSY